MPAPTIARPAQAVTASTPGATANTQTAPALIPFTRAARKKSRIVGTYSGTVGTAQVPLPPIQIPANGYIRDLILDFTLTTAANAATVAFQNDAPFNVLQQVSLAAANGDSLINPLDGFAVAMVNKYGAFDSQGQDPLFDPTYSKVVGAGSTGGSAHFQFEIPFEYDSRDACGALPNMAANQSFLLQGFINTLANLYTTAPTTAPTWSLTITAEYWAAPAAMNTQGVAQQTAPRCNNLVSLLQVANPPIVPGTDQVFQLPNVGNTVRWIMFILRNASGVRDDADWPNVFNLFVNNDLWLYKTKNNWKRQMAQDYNFPGGIQTSPTVNCLDTGVYIITDFMNDGGQGSEYVSSSANRDLMLVTGSGTALNVEAQNWGGSASSLQVITNSLRIPDPSSFYAPLGI
jgi:hypothetical protein